MALSHIFVKDGGKAKYHMFSKLENHDWYQTSSGCWHRTSSRIAVAFELLEDVYDV